MRATKRFSMLFVWMLSFATLLTTWSSAIAQYPAPPRRPTVSDVVINGNRWVKTLVIKNMLKTRAGSLYIPEVVQQDVQALYASKYFSNANYTVQYDEDKVKVHFNVTEYPSRVQKITFLGAKHLKEEDLRNIVEQQNVFPGLPLNPTSNRLACRAIVRKLQDDGRLFAQCDLLEGDKPGQQRVIFNITEGPIVAVSDIQFEGITFVSAGVLRTHLISSRKVLGIFGGKYNAEMVEADIRKLEDYYKGFGYFDVHVSREFRLLSNHRDAVIIYHVLEGPQYQIENTPQIVGAKQVPKEQLEHLVQVKPGEIFSRASITGDTERIKQYIGYTGREASVQPVPIFNPDKPGVVTVNYEVQERAPARVGYIYIVGNTRTRQDKILNQIPLFPGQVLTYPDLRVAERNLARLNIFESTPDGAVRPTITVLDNPSDPNSEYKDVLVTVKEANTGSLLFGFGVNSDAGLTGSIVLNERNFDITRLPTSWEDLLGGGAFRGAGQELRIEAVPGTQLQRYTVQWRDPYFLNTPYSLGVGGYYYTRGFNEYLETRLGGRVNVSRNLNDVWSVNAGTRLERVSVFDVPTFAPTEIAEDRGSHFLLGLQAGARRDTRDSFLRPTEGSVIDASFEQVLGDYDFPTLNLEVNKYFTIYERPDQSGRHVLALRSQASWAGGDVPVFERFYAGGIRTVRGFDFRGMGPDINGFKTGGQFMWLNSVEYQVPLLANDKVYAVGFVDSGTVENDVSIRNYRVSAGFGFRFVVPMLGPMPIALDFGFPLVKAPFDDERIFNFFVGFTR